MSEPLTLRLGGALYFGDGDARLARKLTIRIEPVISSVSIRFHFRRRIAACHIVFGPDGAGTVTDIGLMGGDDAPFKVALAVGPSGIVLRRKPGAAPAQVLIRDQSAPLRPVIPLVRGPAWERSGRTAASDADEIARLCASIASGHGNAHASVSATLQHIRTPDRSDLAALVLGALADRQTGDTSALALNLLLAART